MMKRRDDTDRNADGDWLTMQANEETPGHDGFGSVYRAGCLVIDGSISDRGYGSNVQRSYR